MDDESRRVFLREFRRYQGLLRELLVDAHAGRPSSGDHLAGAGSVEGSSPGHLRDQIVHAAEASYDEDLLQDAEPTAKGGDLMDDDDEVDGEYEEGPDDSEPFGREDILRITEMLEHGLYEEAYHFFHQRLDPDTVEYFEEIMEFMFGLPEDNDDILERVYQAVADGRLLAPRVQAISTSLV
ncbi:hypothetical protein ACP70R_021913 [Stipagrostis hirtigluma subsp. patula]